MSQKTDQIIAAIVSKKATVISVVVAAIIWLAGTGEAAQTLVDTFGLRPDWAVRTVNFARFALVIAAASGHPLFNKKPNNG